MSSRKDRVEHDDAVVSVGPEAALAKDTASPRCRARGTNAFGVRADRYFATERATSVVNGRRLELRWEVESSELVDDDGREDVISSARWPGTDARGG